jgi:hypothetical protein
VAPTLAGTFITVALDGDTRRRYFTFKAKVLGAAVTILLFTFSSLITTTMQLLYCVDVPTPDGGVARRLFIDGTQECDMTGWQLPLLVLLCALALCPAVVFVLARASRRLASRGSFSVQVVHDILTARFRRECYWWESVLLTHRLVLAVARNFLDPYPLLRVVIVYLTCMFFFTLHMAVQPMVSREANVAQGVLLGCLLTLSAVVGVLFYATSEVDGDARLPRDRRLLSLVDVVVAFSAFIIPVVATIVCAVVSVMPPLSVCCRSRLRVYGVGGALHSRRVDGAGKDDDAGHAGGAAADDARRGRTPPKAL